MRFRLSGRRKVGTAAVMATAALGLADVEARTLAFSLGPNPITATGTFTNGRGGCPVATSFRDTFEFLAPGDGTLTITQPSTRDRVSGSITNDGTFRLRSTGEAYDGRIVGKTATATYAYTARGCTETYDATFDLQRPESDLQLALRAPARGKVGRALVFRFAVANAGPHVSPGAALQFRTSRALVGTVYRWGPKAGVNEPKRITCSKVAKKKAVVRWTCTVPQLQNGEAAGIAIAARPRQAGPHVAQASVLGVNFDPALTNNAARRQTSVAR